MEAFTRCLPSSYEGTEDYLPSPQCLLYNEERPHSARDRSPMVAWRALDKATIVIDGQPGLAHTRVRRDRVDRWGSFTLRHRSKLHHVAVGRPHKGERILVLVADLDIRVLDEHGTTLRPL